MKVKGRYYLIENSASVNPRYWDANNMVWTHNPYDASFYETRVQAANACELAEQHTTSEAYVAQALKDLPSIPPPVTYENPIDLMHRTGGSFAQSIAQAYFHADSSNRLRLHAAFPELFAKYEQQFNQWSLNHE